MKYATKWPHDFGAWLMGLLFVLPLALSCDPASGTQCQRSENCLTDQVCVGSTCRQVCNFNSDCGELLYCFNGACVPTMVTADSGFVDSARLDIVGRDQAAPPDSQTVRDAAPQDITAVDQGRADSGATDLVMSDLVMGDQGSGDQESMMPAPVISAAKMMRAWQTPATASAAQ